MSEIQAVAEDVWQYRLQREVLLQLRHGVQVESLRPESYEARQERADFARQAIRRLDDVNQLETPQEDWLTEQFLRWLLGSWIDTAAFHFLEFGVTPYASSDLTFLLQHVFVPFEFDGPADADRYLGLVVDFCANVSELERNLAAQKARSILLPSPAVAGTLETLRGHKAAAIRLLSVDRARTRCLGAAARSAFDEHLNRLIEEGIGPAFDRLLAEFDGEYLAAAPANPGCHSLKGGDEYYAKLIIRHTGQARTAENLHALGLEHVALLKERMADSREAMGFRGDEADFHSQLAGDPALFASNPQEVEARYLAHLRQLERVVGQLFRVLPMAPYGLRRLPQELESGLTYGYYQQPTSAVPVGQYLYNGSDLGSRSMLISATLIFHELAPGHHFQLARQAESEGLPRVRRESYDMSAFVEGWAEYAASLGWELGLYSNPLDAYGRLADERLMAQRLVVDTGLNALGWSLQRAHEYMRDNSLESDQQVASELLRYSTDMPAQALAYRTGHVAFSSLREYFEHSLGTAFDIKDFHEEILTQGCLPFPALKGHLERVYARDEATPRDGSAAVGERPEREVG